MKNKPHHHELPSRNVLFCSVRKLKKESFLDDNVSEDHLRMSMLYVQDVIVERVTGSCLAEQLRYLISRDLINEPSFRYYQELLDHYIFHIIAYGVQADITIPLTFKTRNQGNLQVQGDGLSPTRLDDLQYINRFYNQKRDVYISRACDFLRCHAGHFHELCGCFGHCGCATAPFHRDYKTGLNLARSPKPGWL